MYMSSSQHDRILVHTQSVILDLLDELAVEDVLIVLRVHSLSNTQDNLFILHLERHIGLNHASFNVHDVLHILYSFNMMRHRYRHKIYSVFHDTIVTNSHLLSFRDLLLLYRISHINNVQSYTDIILNTIYSRYDSRSVDVVESVYMLYVSYANSNIVYRDSINNNIDKSPSLDHIDVYDTLDILYIVSYRHVFDILSPSNRKKILSHFNKVLSLDAIARLPYHTIINIVTRLDDEWDSGRYTKTEYMNAYGHVLSNVLQHTAHHHADNSSRQFIINFYSKLSYDQYDNIISKLFSPAT